MTNSVNFYKSLQPDYRKSTKIIYFDTLKDVLLKIKKSEKGSKNRIIKALLPNSNYLIKKSYLNENHPNFINLKRKKDNSLMISYLTIKDIKFKILNNYTKEKFKAALKMNFNLVSNSYSFKDTLEKKTPSLSERNFCINTLLGSLKTIATFPHGTNNSENVYLIYLSNLYLNMYHRLYDAITFHLNYNYKHNWEVTSELRNHKFNLLKILYNSIINNTNYIKDVKEFYGLNSKEYKSINSKFNDETFELLTLLMDKHLYTDPSIRKQIKPGKFITKLFNNGVYKSTEIEDFVELLASEFTNISKDNIKIIKGPAIPYYYNEINYTYYKEHNKKHNTTMEDNTTMEEGTEALLNNINDQEENEQFINDLGGGQLGNSCMRYNYCTKEQLNLYADNPETIGMLVLFDTNKKIAGRCIIWKNNEMNMFDRIYANSNLTRHKMYKWLLNRNYINISNSNKNYTGKNYIDKTIKVPVKNYIYKKYPYLDTFKYLDLKNKKLLNRYDNNDLNNEYLYSIGNFGFDTLGHESRESTDYIMNAITNYEKKSKNIENLLKADKTLEFKNKLYRYIENYKINMLNSIYTYSWSTNNINKLKKSSKNEPSNSISILKYSIRNGTIGTIESKKCKVSEKYKKIIEKLGIIDKLDNLKPNKSYKEENNFTNNYNVKHGPYISTMYYNTIYLNDVEFANINNM